MKILRSPNFSRGRREPVDLIIIHYISIPPGEFGTGRVIDLFMNRLHARLCREIDIPEDLRVSAHYFIDRTGDIYQFVDPQDEAWHAGESSFEGRPDCNRFSIGIELEGDAAHPFEEAQYESLARLCCGLMDRYPTITPERIVGHSDVAPGRKQDPGPMFDWNRFKQILKTETLRHSD